MGGGSDYADDDDDDLLDALNLGSGYKREAEELSFSNEEEEEIDAGSLTEEEPEESVEELLGSGPRHPDEDVETKLGSGPRHPDEDVETKLGSGPSPGLPPGVPDIPGLTADAEGTLWFKGEKVTSITGMDGEDKGRKVFGSEDEEDEEEGDEVTEMEDEDEEDEVVENVEPLEKITAVEKLTPVKKIEEVKSMTPLKSIKEIKNIEEVKSILPIPEHIARKFIAKHKLKKQGGLESASDSPIAQGGVASESAPEVYHDDPPKYESKIKRLRTIHEHLTDAVRHLVKGHKQLKEFIYQWEDEDVDGESEPTEDMEVQFEEEIPIPQGGTAYEQEQDSNEESSAPFSSDEIEEITPLSSIKPIKSIKEVKSMKEVKALYELTPKQAELLKEMNRKHLGGETAADVRGRRRRMRRKRI